MKKIMILAAVAMMSVACCKNCNKNAEEGACCADTVAVECCEHHCCADSACCGHCCADSAKACCEHACEAAAEEVAE